MTEAEERGHPEPSSCGQRRPPRPPVRVTGAMADGFPDDDGWPRNRNWPLSPEHLKQIEKSITWPTAMAACKVDDEDSSR
jgi:hypothetical protein